MYDVFLKVFISSIFFILFRKFIFMPIHKIIDGLSHTFGYLH